MSDSEKKSTKVAKKSATVEKEDLPAESPPPKKVKKAIQEPRYKSIMYTSGGVLRPHIVSNMHRLKSMEYRMIIQSLSGYSGEADDLYTIYCRYCERHGKLEFYSPREFQMKLESLVDMGALEVY